MIYFIFIIFLEGCESKLEINWTREISVISPFNRLIIIIIVSKNVAHSTSDLVLTLGPKGN